jgi:chromatin assembly factor 1 subunit B
VAILKEPKGFVQGVAYEPKLSTYAILSTDRCLRIYSANNRCIHNVNKIQIVNKENDPSPTHNARLFHDDTMKSFFRRMAYSPDGNLLFTPGNLPTLKLNF